MKGLLRTGLLIFVSILIAGCGGNTEAQDAAGEEMAASVEAGSAGDTAREARLDALYVTLRGEGIRVELAATPGSVGLESTDTTQVYSAEPEALLSRQADRAGLSVSIDGRDWQSFSMATDTAHEGKLFRIHVDRPEGLDECQYTAIATGYYSRMWSDDAVRKQKTKCIPCGEILVCGVNPTCP